MWTYKKNLITNEIIDEFKKSGICGPDRKEITIRG